MRRSLLILAVAVSATTLRSHQTDRVPAGHVHVPGMTREATEVPPRPRQVGQAAYAAIAEIVRILEADPATDWSKVDLERLRQHLLDMDDVTMRALVVQRPVEGGVEATVTGTGRTVGAIQRMTASHAAALAAGTAYRMTVMELPDGVRVRMTPAMPGDAALVARIRGLGFIGIMASDDHHAPHHLALARGTVATGHQH
jgi:hypothetical protein